MIGYILFKHEGSEYVLSSDMTWGDELRVFDAKCVLGSVPQVGRHLWEMEGRKLGVGMGGGGGGVIRQVAPEGGGGGGGVFLSEGRVKI